MPDCAYQTSSCIADQPLHRIARKPRDIACSIEYSRSLKAIDFVCAVAPALILRLDFPVWEYLASWNRECISISPAALSAQILGSCPNKKISCTCSSSAPSAGLLEVIVQRFEDTTAVGIHCCAHRLDAVLCHHLQYRPKANLQCCPHVW